MIIPTLGERNDLLHKTLQSLVDQNIKNNVLDIVIVCPQNKLETRKIAADFGAIIADDPSNPRGISAAVNVGISTAKPWHEYIAWMGDDDLLNLDSIITTQNALDSNQRATVAFGYCDYINSDGDLLFTSRAGRFAPWIMSWGPDLVPLPGALFRLSAINKAGVFDPSLKYAMDLDMFLRLRKLGKFINVHRTIGVFRWHPTSTTVTDRMASIQESEQVKRRYLSKPLKVLAPIWEKPVRLATWFTVRRVNKLANS
jgi:GT2 family glycosyltransferase